MDLPRLLPLRFNVDASAIVHSFLREIKVIAFRIMSAESGERSNGRSLKHSDIGMLFLDARNCLLDVVDIDAEVMEPRYIAGFSPDHRHTDIAVADTHCVIHPDRFFLFSRPGLGPFHAEHGLVKLGLADEVFTDNGGMLYPG